MVIQISYILYIRKNSFIYECNSQNGIKERIYSYIINIASSFYLKKKKTVQEVLCLNLLNTL